MMNEKDYPRYTRRRFLGIAGMAAAASAFPLGRRTGSAYAASVPFAEPIPEEEAIIAFGHVGPTSDEGWTWTHHLGKKAVEKAFPKLKTLEVESIPYSSEATRTFREFVANGADMMILSSEFGDLLYQVSDRNPNLAFLECNGHSERDNVIWYYPEHWFPTYIIGVAAGLLTKSNKLGYVASFPVPAVFCSVNAFQMGARSVNPHAQTQVIKINSWFDPQAAHQAGDALISDGCDFLMGIMDEPAYLQLAEKKGVWAAVWNTDIRKYGPNAYVSSVLVDWRDFYVAEVRKRLEGNWTGNRGVLLPMGEGTDRDEWGINVPQDVQAKADAVRTKIMNENYNPFVGPIKDVNGKLRLKEGEVMDGYALFEWDWAIEGTTGLA